MTLTSLRQRIESAKAQYGIALLPFIAGGYPDVPVSMSLLPALETGGAAAAEVGFPFSDPIADGPTIQEAFTIALAKGLKVDHVFDGIESSRPSHTLPLVAMVSYSIVFRYGVERFVARSKSAGFAAILIPDLPPPEAEPTCDIVHAAGLQTVLLVSPATPPARRQLIARLCSGFVYYLSLSGVTGERDRLPDGIEDSVRQLKQLTDVPVCVGFGISRREHVLQLSGVADGAIVGSALVKRIKNSPNPSADACALARELLGT